MRNQVAAFIDDGDVLRLADFLGALLGRLGHQRE